MGQALDLLISKLASQRTSGNAVCDVSSSSVRLVRAPVPADLALELAALAEVFAGSSECLAGELLSAAISDMWESMDDQLQVEATCACQSILDSSRPELPASVQFNMGGT